MNVKYLKIDESTIGLVDIKAIPQICASLNITRANISVVHIDNSEIVCHY